jgi:hypothetical protein
MHLVHSQRGGFSNSFLIACCVVVAPVLHAVLTLLQMTDQKKDMVDMRIIKFGIWGPKSRSVKNFSQRSDFGLLELILDKSSLI